MVNREGHARGRWDATERQDEPVLDKYRLLQSQRYIDQAKHLPATSWFHPFSQKVAVIEIAQCSSVEVEELK